MHSFLSAVDKNNTHSEHNISFESKTQTSLLICYITHSCCLQESHIYCSATLLDRCNTVSKDDKSLVSTLYIKKHFNTKIIDSNNNLTLDQRLLFFMCRFFKRLLPVYMHTHISRGINQAVCVSNRCSVYSAHHTHTLMWFHYKLHHCHAVCVYLSVHSAAAGLSESLMCTLHCSISPSYDHMTTHSPVRDVNRKGTKTTL